MAKKRTPPPIVDDPDTPQRMLTFVEHWMATGNGTRSAEAAGYRGSPESLAATSSRLLKHVKVQAAIKVRRQAMEAAGSTMTREERQAWWTSVIKDPAASTRDKLRASELLGRGQGDFIEQVEVRQDVQYHITWDMGNADLGTDEDDAIDHPPVPKHKRRLKR